MNIQNQYSLILFIALMVGYWFFRFCQQKKINKTHKLFRSVRSILIDPNEEFPFIEVRYLNQGNQPALVLSTQKENDDVFTFISQALVRQAHTVMSCRIDGHIQTLIVRDIARQRTVRLRLFETHRTKAGEETSSTRCFCLVPI